MAIVGFKPDPDLFDPNDPEGWVGHWEHDDGSPPVYGLGSAELGQPLMRDPRSNQPDQRLAQNDAEDPGARQAQEWLAEGGQQMAPSSPQVAPRTATDAGGSAPATPAPGASPGAPAPATGQDDAGHGWRDDVPGEVAQALEQAAADAGLNPAVLAQVVKKESGWDPSRVNAKTGKHGGLIQFAEDGWADVARAAGTPDVTWQDMLRMPAAEQLRYVGAYYKGKGLTPESTLGDYGRRTFMPAYANEGMDFRLAERGSDADRGGLRSGKIYEQNQGMDLNRDGVITNQEAGDFYAGGSGGGGAGPRLAPSPGGPQVPGSLGGAPLQEIGMRGMPKTPQQIQAEQQAVGQRYAAAAGAHQQAQQLRMEGAAQAMGLLQQQKQQEELDAAAREQKAMDIRQQADMNVQREVMAPIQKVDPRRYIKTMSTGDKVLGAIAILISGIGQAAQMMLGQKSTTNTALDIIGKAIDDDIDAQKQAIAEGRAASNSRVAYWTAKRNDAIEGELAARAEKKQAAASWAQAQIQNSQLTAEQKAAGLEWAAQLFAQAQNDVQAIADRENDRLTMRYETPKVTQQTAENVLKEVRAAKELDQERRLGAGETVPQHKARLDAEAQAEEETSKELEPIAVAEQTWQKAQAALDAIAQRGLVSRRHSEPAEMSGSDMVPGSPTVDEVHGFNQAFDAAVNAMITAEKGSQTPEDVARVKAAIQGTGTVEDIARGIQNQLDRLNLLRRQVGTRREGAGARIEQRSQRRTPQPITTPIPRGQ